MAAFPAQRQPSPGTALLAGPWDRHVKVAWVPAHLRLVFEHLPRPLLLDAWLPAEPALLPQAARQLLKIAVTGNGLALRELAAAEGGLVRLVVSTDDDRRCVLEPADLALDLSAVLERVFGALLGAADFTRALESFALRSANLATLQRILGHMLQSTDVEKALHAMLCGVTSGLGLGFNRAALFVFDETPGVFRGARAVGPADGIEARRIWEDLEYHDRSIDSLVAGYADAAGEGRFQRFVRGVELTAAGGDEIDQALQAGAPLLLHGSPRNAGLGRLGVASEFVLAAIRPHGQVLGLLVADNLYSATPVRLEQLSDLGRFLDQTALVWENLSLLGRIEKLAREDGLTGLLNRREFEARFGRECSRCERHNEPCALLVLDIDHFKQVNDRLGHAAGDEVLRRTARILEGAVRGHDLVARHGGDEFVVFLPGASGVHLRAAALRIGTLARDAGIGVSIGGAAWPGDCDAPARLVAVADEHLYRAKNAGRGRASFGATAIDFADPASSAPSEDARA